MRKGAAALATDGIDADGRLMDRVAAGDAAACRLIAQQHLSPVVALAARMLGDRAAAEDVAQEAFVRLWRQAGRWRAEARIATWLYRVAYNLCLDQLRRRGRDGAAALEDTAEVVAAIPDPAPGPGAALDERETAALLDREIQALPERQRAALTLVHFRGLPGPEAASMLGISLDALESLLARARRRLRSRLADQRQALLEEWS